MKQTIRAHPRIAPCLYPTIRSSNTSFDPCIEELPYDSLGRLERIDYPRIDDTRYTYGGPEAPHNRAGRIARIEVDSGSTENFYGKLGERKRTIKTVRRLDPNGGTKSADFSYRYDYQGRMREITYPDEETITYHYNRGGQVEKINSELHGLETTYVEQIGYDEYDQRVYLRYGNGVETHYRYDEERRWLKQIETNNRLQTLQDSTYHFDAVGNITRIANSASRYTTVQEYEYDGLYQLTGAEGTFEDREYGSLTATHRYSQSFSYDQLGNLLTKESSNEVSPSGGSSGLNYRLEYDYYPDRPTRAERIGSLWYLYDPNGNVIEEREGGHSSEAIEASGTLTTAEGVSTLDRGIGLTRGGEEEGPQGYLRRYSWDEENRLRASSDGRATVAYRYDHSGMRTTKYVIEGAGRGETLYFSKLWLAREDSPDFRRSKNIYLGEKRIATRANKENDPSTGYEELNTYYYHADHLGSSNIVTDPDGEPYEHLEYTPFGETWIEKTSDAARMLPYRFTGKELDRETGLYYYGARYLNPKSSRWVSGDPAFEEYLPVPPVDEEARKHNENLPGMGGVFNLINLNTYHYSGNNPVKYLDPNGREVIVLNQSDGAFSQGHNAVIIGNDEDGWHYYSKDGYPDEQGNSKNRGGEGFTYSSLDEFFASEDPNEDGITFGERYDRKERIETNQEQDTRMIKKGNKMWNEDYNFFENNCGDQVNDILTEGGIDTGDDKVFGVTRPNTQFENILENYNVNSDLPPNPDVNH